MEGRGLDVGVCEVDDGGTLERCFFSSNVGAAEY